MKVAVLGCGPSGLVAAHAATVAGCNVTILSKTRKSELFGAQYLHAPIPGMTDKPPVEVVVQLAGTHDQYRDKVYGHRAPDVASVSTEDLPHPHSAWDIRNTYDNLWDAYVDDIVDYNINGDIVGLLAARYDVVISTIPAKAFCHAVSTHAFIGQAIYALGDAPERGLFVRDWVPMEEMEHPRMEHPRSVKNFIHCNGKAVPSWYRMARVFNRTTVEWPSNVDVPFDVATTVTKPISTDCDCNPEIFRMGRYGQWKKGVLVHHVYEQALALCVDGLHS